LAALGAAGQDYSAAAAVADKAVAERMLAWRPLRHLIK
jgi:hypothetical protein